ncbi:hypothetical protein GH714_003100 [Hevea brasiliensis]|uniref:Beta-glucosidase n=1 Tax=Hevea brasiliensis TaxID=3981 RepID=A0A6A6KZR8_HEVBR|nr:hypothetical protein GH714_003100 [Hevea brasiliensis]
MRAVSNLVLLEVQVSNEMNSPNKELNQRKNSGYDKLNDNPWHRNQGVLIVFLISLLVLTKLAMADDCDDIPADFNRTYFPDDFIFGTATSAYQIEGAANILGKGPRFWDTFTHEHPERIKDHSSGDVAVDFYHRFREDIKNMKDMGFNAFRFSISWPRVIPSGKRRGGVNEEGIEFYNTVINETMHKIKEAFPIRDIGALHYFLSLEVNHQCRAGNSSTEPYIVAHHLLLTHAAVVQVYREHYKATQNGKIRITLFTFWFEPLSNRIEDIEASKIALDFMFGLWMDPLTNGRYPRIVQDLVGDRLLKFTDKETQLLQGSYDFIGLQYYTLYNAKPNALIDPDHIRYKTDSHVTETSYDYDGNLIGPQAYSSWFYIFQKGIRHLLNYTKDTYNDPVIYITENGVDYLNNETHSIEEALQDEFRINY